MIEQEKVSTPDINRWKNGTWHSLETMAGTLTGLPDDRVDFDPAGITYSGCTSPTNIGVFVTNVVAARDLGMITGVKATDYVRKVVDTVQNMERPSGLLPNKISTSTARPVCEDPYSGTHVENLVSSVDMGWCFLGLTIAGQAVPELTFDINSLLSTMDFRLLFDVNAGLFYGHRSLETGQPSGHRFILKNSETRILAYLADKFGFSSKECLSKLVARPRDIPVREGSNSVVIPSCGGTMFEDAWALQFFRGELLLTSRLKNHLAYMGEQLKFGGVDCCLDPSLPDSDLAPVNRPAIDRNAHYPYALFGLASLAIFPYANKGVLNPQASFLALPMLPEEAIANLVTLETRFPEIYKPDFGFLDAVDTNSGRIAYSQLYPNQGMGFNGIFNYLTGFRMHSYVEAAYPQLTTLLMDSEI